MTQDTIGHMFDESKKRLRIEYDSMIKRVRDDLADSRNKALSKVGSK